MSDKSRRKLLKSIAAGSGAILAGKSLPENWSKPVVDSVMLPAHAQTSMPVCVIAGTYCFIRGNGATLTIVVQADGTLTIRFVNNGGGRIWEGTDSVPLTGGAFDTPLTQIQGGGNVTRTVNGTIVCNSTDISGESIRNGTVQDNYTASQGTCP